ARRGPVARRRVPRGGLRLLRVRRRGQAVGGRRPVRRDDPGALRRGRRAARQPAQLAAPVPRGARVPREPRPARQVRAPGPHHRRHVHHVLGAPRRLPQRPRAHPADERVHVAM
ncbi:MAG: hypothetical protein AVDCRST_MAG38-2199, partial [uncultured Solirubrobacteraceae bacterium]